MENAYLGLLQDVLQNGTHKDDRTGTGTLSVFGRQIRCNLQDGFPAITTKKLFFKGVIAELLWFLKGSTNVSWLQEQNVHIWDAWADSQGELGPVYGKQWRSWTHYDTVGPDGLEVLTQKRDIDQLESAIWALKYNPDSRRMLVSAWNVGELSRMALEPCHVLFQFYTRPLTLEQRHDIAVRRGVPGVWSWTEAEREQALNQAQVPTRALDCQLYQRSADLFLGVPFNIASYALLTHMVAQVTGLEPGEYVHTFGDAHIYLNHLEQVREQLSRAPRDLPTLWVNPDIRDIDGFSLEDFKLDGYYPHPAITAPIAV